MAKFDLEFEKVILVEGGYTNDPHDKGGETYLGISRRNNPSWKGWMIIDNIKELNGSKGLNGHLKKNTELNRLAKNIYKYKYWDKLKLDDIPNQSIAHQLFDTAVNCGICASIKIAQQCCNISPTGKWSKELETKLKNYK